MTSRQRIWTVLQGQIPDRIPVSLFRINPLDTCGFWSEHRSFTNLLNKAKEYCDTFAFYKPDTGFFFSQPGSINIKTEKKKDTAISETVSLTVETSLGPLTRMARTTRMSSVQWVVKPWVGTFNDLKRFLSLPYAAYSPDMTVCQKNEIEYGEKAVTVISLPDPVGVAGVLFATGDLPKFIMENEKLVEKTLDELFKRLVPVYQSISRSMSNIIIRIRGSEYLTPPVLPPGHFPNYKEIFNNFIIRYDTKLINIIRQGNFNFVCYHWHDVTEELLPMVLKMEPDILEPVVNTEESPQNAARIRKICGSNMTLMGGPTLEDFEFRSNVDIVLLTTEIMSQAAKKGRFILIPFGVPTAAPLNPQTEQNFLAFIETAVQNGVYPLSE